MTDDILDIALVGDVMPGGLSVPPLDADEVRRETWMPVRGADVVLANLECPITSAGKPRTSKNFNFKASESCLDLFDSRFVLSLANNHIMDYGRQGLEDSLASLQRRGQLHAGAGGNLHEASRPAVLTVKGVRVGVLCATDPRWEPAGESTPGTLPAAPGILAPLLKQLRSRVDVMVISLHVGVEYNPYPTPVMLALADLCVSGGADIVAFHHSHCLSGWQRRSGAIVLWGLGNYLFTSADEESNSLWVESAAWRVKLPGCRDTGLNVYPVPVILTGTGVPAPADGAAARRILNTVAGLSRRMDSVRFLPLWRLLSLFSWRYISIALKGYLTMLCRQGPASVIGSIMSTFRTHFMTRVARSSDPSRP